MKACLPSFLLRWFETVKLAMELRRRAREREIEQEIPFDESRLPIGCRLRNHCGCAGDELRCPISSRTER